MIISDGQYCSLKKTTFFNVFGNFERLVSEVIRDETKLTYQAECSPIDMCRDEKYSMWMHKGFYLLNWLIDRLNEKFFFFINNKIVFINPNLVTKFLRIIFGIHQILVRITLEQVRFFKIRHKAKAVYFFDRIDFSSARCSLLYFRHLFVDKLTA